MEAAEARAIAEDGERKATETMSKQGAKPVKKPTRIGADMAAGQKLKKWDDVNNRLAVSIKKKDEVLNPYPQPELVAPMHQSEEPQSLLQRDTVDLSAIPSMMDERWEKVVTRGFVAVAVLALAGVVLLVIR